MKPDIVLVAGAPKTHKSSFAATFPENIEVFGFDVPGFDRAYGLGEIKEVNPNLLLAKDGKIKIHRYFIPRKFPTDLGNEKEVVDPKAQHPTPTAAATKAHNNRVRLKGYLTTWELFTNDFEVALEDKAVATMVIDTWSVCERLKIDAWLEFLQEQQPPGAWLRENLDPSEYGPRNRDMETILQTPFAYGKKLVLISHMKDEYVGNKPTGEIVPDAYNKTQARNDLTIMATKFGKEFKLAIIESGMGDSLVGKPIPDGSYAGLMKLIEKFG